MSDDKKRDAMTRLGAQLSPDRTKPRLVSWWLKDGTEIQMHVVLPGKKRWWAPDIPEKAFAVNGYGVKWKYDSGTSSQRPTDEWDPPAWLCAILADLYVNRHKVAEQQPDV